MLNFATFLWRNTMLLGVFRNNQTIAGAWLLVYAAVLRLPAILGWIEPSADLSGQGGALYLLLPDWLATTGQASAMLATALVLFQAFYLNHLADKYRLLEDRNWVPGMMYVLLASMLPDFQWLSPPLLSVTLLPVALDNLFSLYKRPNVAMSLFDAGFWLAAGSLSYAPLLWLAPASLIGIRLLRSYSLPERLIYVLGCLTPYFLCWVCWYWEGAGSEFWRLQAGGLWQGVRQDFPVGVPDLAKQAAMGFLLLAVLLNTGSLYAKKSIQVQKYTSALFIFLITAFLVSLVTGSNIFTHFILLVVPLSLLQAITVEGIRSDFWANLYHYVLLIVLFFLNFYHRIPGL